MEIREKGKLSRRKFLAFVTISIFGGTFILPVTLETFLRITGYEPRNTKNFFWASLGYDMVKEVKKDGTPRFKIEPEIRNYLVNRERKKLYYAFDEDIGVYIIGSDDFSVNLGPFTVSNEWVPYKELCIADFSVKTKKIVLYGGSAAFGWFLKSNQTIAAFLQSILRKKYDLENVVVINAGKPGADSDDCLRIMNTIIKLQKPIINIYLGGNNEFLDFINLRTTLPVAQPLLKYLGFASRRHKKFRLKLLEFLYDYLWNSMADLEKQTTREKLLTISVDFSKMPDYLISDDVSHLREVEQIYKKFEYNLIKMANVCRENNSYLVFCTIPINPRRRPAKSIDGINDKANRLYTQAREFDARGNLQKALDLYLQAADEDKSWLGAKRRNNEILRYVSKITRTPIAELDLIDIYYNLSKGYYNGFIDFCHFTSSGAYEAANKIAEIIFREYQSVLK